MKPAFDDEIGKFLCVSLFLIISDHLSIANKMLTKEADMMVSTYDPQEELTYWNIIASQIYVTCPS